jgi:hypothetical protein
MVPAVLKEPFEPVSVKNHESPYGSHRYMALPSTISRFTPGTGLWY